MTATTCVELQDSRDLHDIARYSDPEVVMLEICTSSDLEVSVFPALIGRACTEACRSRSRHTCAQALLDLIFYIRTCPGGMGRGYVTGSLSSCSSSPFLELGCFLEEFEAGMRQQDAIQHRFELLLADVVVLISSQHIEQPHDRGRLQTAIH